MPGPIIDFESSLILRHPKTQFRDIGGEIFLVHPDGEQIHNLNPMAAALWRLMEEPISGREMAEVLQSAFPIMAMSKVDGDVQQVLNQFLELGFALIKTP